MFRLFPCAFFFFSLFFFAYKIRGVLFTRVGKPGTKEAPPPRAMKDGFLQIQANVWVEPRWSLAKKKSDPHKMDLIGHSDPSNRQRCRQMAGALLGAPKTKQALASQKAWVP